MKVDYSLYLVTSRTLVPTGKDFYETVEKAIAGGVTVVQVREKSCDTGEFLEIAQKTQEICRKHGVPLIINDRIDIALAIGAEGVHLGQTDMPIAFARRLLPSGSIIGISCNNSAHAVKAAKDGADYIGIGSIWSTKTKQLTEPVVGVRGVGEILESIHGAELKVVAIGGIHSDNLIRTLHGAVSASGRTLDGVAVVSDIMASSNPVESAKRLSETIRKFQAVPTPIFSINQPCTEISLVKNSASLLKKIRETNPLIHQITNNVVINQSANATLALGGSPIMATAAPEMCDLSRVSGALLVNFGTIGDLSGMLEAGRWANATCKPIVFDPVAVGATKHRGTSASSSWTAFLAHILMGVTNELADLLNAWQATIIKGNAGEIGALANSSEVKSRGVDSVGSGFVDPVSIIKRLALTERCIIVMSGTTDYVTDGHTAIKLSNGHPLLGAITGSGCMLGTCIATFCAVAALVDTPGVTDAVRLVKGDMLEAAVGGVLALTIAAELAAARSDVKGSGTFLPALIDELYHLTPAKIIANAKVEIVH